ncbi:MAG: hypothetical protein ABIH46_13055 [Chloroflexota bacterium]
MPVDDRTQKAREAWLATPKGQRFQEIKAIWYLGRNIQEQKEYAKLYQEFLKLGMSCRERREWEAQILKDAIEDVIAEKCEAEEEEV